VGLLARLTKRTAVRLASCLVQHATYNPQALFDPRSRITDAAIVYGQSRLRLPYPVTAEWTLPRASRLAAPCPTR